LSANAVFVLTDEQLREALRAVLSEERPQLSAPEAEPLFASCSATCKRLGVSRATLFRARKEGMPAVRVGDDWRYEVAACADWFRGRSK
jgi:hypothetical protein